MFQHGREPSRSDFDVTVQEQEILRMELFVHYVEGFVVASREAMVLLERNDADRRELLFQHLDGAVCGAVVGNYDTGISPMDRLKQPGKEFPEIFFRVPVQYDNRRFQLLSFLVAALMVRIVLVAAAVAVAAMLFFAGEILDVDGLTGGFNLQIAWSTGFVAGNSI